MAPPRLILASSSPRREHLLRGLGLSFEVIPPASEAETRAGSPREYAVAAAREKALGVARRVGDRERVVLGADTIVVLQGEVLGKPRDPEDARRMLRRLAGREHQVLTGFILARPPADVLFEEAVETRVWIRPLSEREIEGYVATGEPMDKAGAYAAQGIGMFLVKAVHGSYANVVGLPVCEVVAALERLGVARMFGEGQG
jgi:septum formation protein